MSLSDDGVNAKEISEARFLGKPEEILRLRQVAVAEYGVIDVTEMEHPLGGDGGKPAQGAVIHLPEPGRKRAGAAIRGFRCQAGLTQKQLAVLTGISQNHISEMENGRCAIGKERASKLALAFSCDYRKFL